MTSHALEAVRQVKMKEAKEIVENYLNDERPVVKKEAIKAFKQIGQV